jgi:hypothetical protein
LSLSKLERGFEAHNVSLGRTAASLNSVWPFLVAWRDQPQLEEKKHCLTCLPKTPTAATLDS